MKNLLLFILFVTIAPCALAQEIENDSVYNLPVNSVSLQILPEFNGGISAFYNYISENYKPKSSGKMIIKFVVEKDGSISDVEVLKSISPKDDKRIIKVIKNSPKWNPGRQNGKIVRTSYSLPITINVRN